MSASTFSRIESLNKENYDTWKMQVEALLIKNDAWRYVNGDNKMPTGEEATADAIRVWSDADSKAKSDLILSIHPSELKQVKGLVTSREVWLRLENIYQSKGPGRKATLLKQLLLHRMENGEDIREHVRKFFDTIDKLNEMEVDINKDLQAIMLLYSLPPCFENFRCAIESRDDLPSPEVLRIKVIEESDARKSDIRGTTQNAMFTKRWNQKKGMVNNSASGKQKSFKYRCHRCREIGHKAVDCPKKDGNTRSTAKSAEDDVILCAIECFAEKQTHEVFKAENCAGNFKWCVDSGATSHLCYDKQLFTKIDVSKRGKLNLASNQSTEITAKGNVSFAAELDGKVKNVNLTEVLFVPDLRTNLLSVSKMTDKGCEVLFTKDSATVIGSDGKIKVTANRVGDLYYICESKQEPCRKSLETANSSEVESSNLIAWHRRLGHLNVSDLRKAQRDNVIIGLDVKEFGNNFECEVCLRGKMTRTPFPTRSDRKSENLEIIHSDLCGPMRVDSKGGAKYFITFIDDRSKWCEIRFLRKKSEAFEAFKAFKALVETQRNVKVKYLQSDNGGEYISTEFNEYLEKCGIQRRLYSQQSGTKRNRRTEESNSS